MNNQEPIDVTFTTLNDLMIKHNIVPDTKKDLEVMESLLSKKEVLTKKVEQEILFKPYIEDTLEVPKSIGSDLEAVSWIDTCLANIFGSTVLRTCLVDLWLDSMSKYIRTLDTEEDLELYFEGVLPNERNVKITNLVTQVHPSDNMVKYIFLFYHFF